MKKIKHIIYGGSFDPLHFGHIDIVSNLSKRFDSVIVVPAYVSPFKSGAMIDGDLRLKLCKKVFKGYNNVVVSNYEIKREGVSYSVNTAKVYAKKCDTLFWAIGSEELSRLGEWQDIKTLAKLVTFYVIERPNFEIDAQLVKRYKSEFGIKIKRAPFSGADISSAEVKIDLAFGKSNAYLPSEVYDVVSKAALFNPYRKYADALITHGLDLKRREHTYRVAKQGSQIAKFLGISQDTAITACLLHDIGKAADFDAYADKIDNFDKIHKDCIHAPVGAIIASQEFGASEEICHAISIHTTGDANMSPLDILVFLADKTEPFRAFEGVQNLRYLTRVDYNKAMLYQLRCTKEHEGSDFCAEGERALEYFESLCADEQLPPMPDKTETLKTEKLVRKIKEPTFDEIITNANRLSSGKYNFSAPLSSEQIALTIADCLSVRKGMDIDIVDVSQKSSLCDYFVVATATSTPMVRALYEAVDERLSKSFNIEPRRRDLDTDWIAVDYGDVILHIFKKASREFYDIERLWSDGANIKRFED